MKLAALSAPTSSGSAKAAPLSENDTEVLIDFENETTNPQLSRSLMLALAAGLEQSPFLNILSDSKVRETLRTMQRPVSATVTVPVGRDICRRTGSTALFSGAVSKASNGYLLDLRAIACTDGSTLADVHGNASSSVKLLSVLARTASTLRIRLGESPSSVRRFDAPIDATAPSLEALELYSIATEVKNERGDGPSVPILKRAIEVDPDFPMPYAALAATYRNLLQPSLALEYAGKAYQLRAGVGERERMRISSTYFLSNGDVDKEIPLYKQWESVYPRDFTPYNDLGNDYAALGFLHDALAQYQHALRITPSVISFTNVVGMYLSLNRLDEARSALAEAFALGLDGRYLRQSLYWLAFLRGNVAGMKHQVEWASRRADDEDVLFSMQSDTEAYYGRMNAARELSSRAVYSAVHAGSRETAALWQVNSALREAELGNAALARRGIASALALSSGRDVLLASALASARAGNVAKADALIKRLERTYPSDTLMKLYWLPTIHAAIELDNSHYVPALKDLRPTVPYELGGAGTFINYLYPAYLRGQVYLQAENPIAAATEFSKLVNHRGIVVNFLTGSLAYLQLGRAYAAAHDAKRAQRAYQEFLALWRGADPDISILQKAKDEYASLSRR